MIRTRSIAILAAVALAFAGTFTIPIAADGSDLHEAWLGGTWWTTITPPPEAGAPPFKLLFTFTEDGSLLATGTAGEFPALGSPCHGVWGRSGDRDFRVTYLCFDFDSALQPAGVDKITGTLSVDRRSRLTGQLKLTHYDNDGNEIFSACCAGVAGTKLHVEP